MAGNDTDADGNATIIAATVALVSGTQVGGTFAVNANGTINFTPTPGYSGTADVDYTVKDEKGLVSAPATLSVAVTAPPTAVNDAASRSYAATGQTIDVLANDVANSGSKLATSVLLGDPSGIPAPAANTYTTSGVMFTANAAGTITYTNPNKFVGIVTVGYTLKNTANPNPSNLGVLTLTLTNATPVAVADNTATTPSNVTLTGISVATNDTDADGNATLDATSVVLTGTQTGGTFTVSNDDTGTINFVPTADFFGTATAQYTIADEKGLTSAPGTLSVTVTVPPTAVNDAISASYKATPTINVLSNDAANSGTIVQTTVFVGDPSGTPPPATRTYTDVASGVVFTASPTVGTITYTNPNKFVGVVRVSYTVKNNRDSRASNTGVLTLTLTNAAPVAVADNGSTANTLPLNNINVAANDTDADGNVTLNATSVALTGTPTGGTFSVNANGTVNFVPALGFVSTATANYTIKDEKGLVSNEATLSITVMAVADVATNITPAPASVNVGDALVFTVVFVNNGPNDAAGFSRTLTLSTNLGASNVTISGANGLTGTYNYTSGAVTFNQVPTTLASGNNLNVTVTIAAVPAALASVVASTTISTSTGQGTGTGANSASSTVTVTPLADVATTLTGPLPSTLTGNVATGNFTVTFINNGPSAAAGVTRIVTLPPGATMTTAQATASGGTYVAPTSTTTSGTLSFGSYSTFTFAFVPFNGNASPVNTTSRITTTTNQNGATGNDQVTIISPVKFTPVPSNVTATSMPSSNGITAIAGLSATDQDGTVASYQVLTVPAFSQGALYYNNGTTDVQIVAAITLTPAQAATLKFAPTGSFAGNITFTYAATDNEGNPSTTFRNGSTISSGNATYTIPVSNGGILANNDSNVVPQNTPTLGNVLLNDVYPGGALAVSTTAGAFSYTSGSTTTTTTYTAGGKATLASGAKVTIAANGDYTYTPPSATYTGPDTFVYQVCSGGTCKTALVTIRVYNTSTACSSSTGPNLLVNSDFNNGNSGFSTYYNFIPRPAAQVTASPGGLYPEGTYAVDNDANYYHGNFQGKGRSNATNAADKFLIVNGAGTIQRVYSQTVSVLPNRYYTFSAYLNNVIAPNGGLGVPEIGFVINGESTSDTRQILESPDRWVQVSDIWYSGSNTSAVFEIRNLSIATNGNDFGIDDVYFGTCNLAPVAANDLLTTPPSTVLTAIISGSGTGSNDFDGDGYIDPTTVDLNPNTVGVQTSYTDANNNKFELSTAGSGAAATVSVVFTPAIGFTGVASIPYVVKDNDGALSNPGTISVTVRPPALDVATSISANLPTIDAGATETLTVRSINNGTAAAAQNVQQLLYLPAGLVTVSFGTPTSSAGTAIAAGQPVYDNLTGGVTFPLITSEPGSGIVAWTVSFVAPANGPFTATAAVSSSINQDPNTGNNTASTTITVTPRFDLSTSISGPASIVQGNLLTYSVTSQNAAASSIVQSGVQTVTGLPTGLGQVFVSNGGVYNGTGAATTVVFDGVSYSVASGSVLFPPQPYAAGQTGSNTISFVPTSLASISPTAIISYSASSGGDINLANNTRLLNATISGTATTTVTTPTATTDSGMTNVYTKVSTNAASPVAGGTAVQVTVTMGNNGPMPAAGVQATVTLQPNLLLTEPANATYNSATGVLTYGSFGTMASTSLQSSSTFSFIAPTTGPVLIAAAVVTSTSDAVPADNMATTKVDILPAADVATFLAGPATATAGKPVTYTVTTVNNGVAAATALAQLVSLPVGLTAADLQFDGSTGTLVGTTITFGSGANATTYSQLTGLLALPVIASAPAGTVRVNSITFTAPVSGGTLLLNAYVGTASTDGTTANNVARLSTTVQSSLDVVVALTGSVTSPVFGSVTYSVTATNNGPAVASSVSRTLQLPTNLTNMVKPADASYASATGLVTFAALSNLASGASVTQSISFTMPDVAQLSGLAAVSVSGTITDSNLDNNRSSFTTRSISPSDPIADLSATVTAPAATVQAGSSITLTATFANGAATNSDKAPGARPLLALPANLTNVTVSNSGSYDIATGLVTWPIVSLVASASAAYTVAFAVPGTGPLVATVSTSSDLSDPDVTNNSRTISIDVTSRVDAATYVTGPGTATAGVLVTYSVTTINNGPSAAGTVTQNVVLPTGVSSYSLNGGASQNGSGTVTILTTTGQQAGAVGAITQTITFTVPSGSGSFVLQGNVVSSVSDFNTANNTNSATTYLTNRTPVAQNVMNTLQTPQGNTAGAALPISPLAATDADDPSNPTAATTTIVRYSLLSLPSAAQGVLYYNKAGTYTAIAAADLATLALSLTQAASLRFAPAQNFAGNATFRFTATDNGNGAAANTQTSNAALYTIVVGRDNNSIYTVNTPKGQANPYVGGDELARVYDFNGGAATALTIFTPNPNSKTAPVNYGADVTNNGVAAAAISSADATKLDGIGVKFSAATGQITVGTTTAELALFKKAVGTYTVSVTTTDANGGVNTQNVTFTIGAFPLPVVLTDFTARAVKNLDAALLWHTAQEVNNDHFEVERSLNGTVFVKIGVVQGQGSKTTPTEYALTDAGIGPKSQGQVYYRLKQVDTDGETSYSPVRTVFFTTALTPAIVLFPNPATTGTQLDLTALPTGRYQVSVLDATGRVVLNATLEAGLAHMLDLNTIASGTYNVLVRGQSNGQPINLTKRLIKE